MPTGLSVADLAGLVAENHEGLLARETRVLILAAAWADAHDLDASLGDHQPLIERACAWGGPGTPSVSEYAAAELGVAVQAGQVRAWQARKVAEATREPLVGGRAAGRRCDRGLPGDVAVGSVRSP